MCVYVCVCTSVNIEQKEKGQWKYKQSRGDVDKIKASGGRNDRQRGLDEGRGSRRRGAADIRVGGNRPLPSNTFKSAGSVTFDP